MIILSPILRNKTRWSSTFEMINRYNQIRPYVPESDLDLMSLVLEDFEEDELKLLTENLTTINSVTLTLQREHGVTLSDIRTLFDGLISKFPDMEHHLSTSAKVVQNKDFENGIVKVYYKCFNVIGEILGFYINYCCRCCTLLSHT